VVRQDHRKGEGGGGENVKIIGKRKSDRVCRKKSEWSQSARKYLKPGCVGGREFTNRLGRGCNAGSSEEKRGWESFRSSILPEEKRKGGKKKDEKEPQFH